MFPNPYFTSYYFSNSYFWGGNTVVFHSPPDRGTRIEEILFVGSNVFINTNSLWIGNNVHANMHGFFGPFYSDILQISPYTINSLGIFGNSIFSKIVLGNNNEVIINNSTISTPNINVGHINTGNLFSGNATNFSFINSTFISTTGTMKFGTFAANTTATLTGFITIQDSSGVTRKLMCFT